MRLMAWSQTPSKIAAKCNFTRRFCCRRRAGRCSRTVPRETLCASKTRVSGREAHRTGSGRSVRASRYRRHKAGRHPCRDHSSRGHSHQICFEHGRSANVQHEAVSGNRCSRFAACAGSTSAHKPFAQFLPSSRGRRVGNRGSGRLPLDITRIEPRTTREAAMAAFAKSWRRK